MERGKMEWSFNWAFWRRSADSQGIKAERGGASRSLGQLEDWESQLIEAGVDARWAPRIAIQLSDLTGELGHEAAPTILRAAIATAAVHSDARADVDRQLKDVREVERLLGAFSGELEKLDEVLEVLSAYAQRMRAKPAKRPRHTLH